MKYCMKCGVSIDEEKNRVCPLCDTIILTDEEIENLSLGEWKAPKKLKKDKVEFKSKKEKKNKMGVTAFVMLPSSIIAIFILLLIDFTIGLNIQWSIIPIISIIVTILTIGFPFMNLNKTLYWYITFDAVVLSIYFLLLNYIINNKISWSYYVVLSIVLLWVYLSSILLNKIKGFVLNISMDFIATALFVLLVLLGFDHTSGFSRLALPINGLVFILTVITYLFIKTYIYNLSMIITTISINVSILCVGIDILTQSFTHDKFYMKWSYIILIVLIPFTLFIIYLNNRYKINKYLIKKFHI